MRLIDADSLLQVIKKNIPKTPKDECQEGQEIGLTMAVEMVCNEPTVDAEQHEHWVHIDTVEYVRKIIGIDVDKDRLIKALELDKRLVRCKDCKYWFSSSGLGGVCEYIRQTQHVGVDTLPNHFCGWGERGSWGDVD